MLVDHQWPLLWTVIGISPLIVSDNCSQPRSALGRTDLHAFSPAFSPEHSLTVIVR